MTLQVEHAGLRPRIEDLKAVADGLDGGLDGGVGPAAVTAVIRQVDRAYDLLVHHVLPHARAEDRVLYPAVELVLGAPGATATMRRDHAEIERLTDELGALRRVAVVTGAAGVLPDGIRIELRRVLYALHAVLGLHLAKEEEIYQPLLESRLEAEAVARLLEEVHHATLDAKAAVAAFDHDAA